MAAILALLAPAACGEMQSFNGPVSQNARAQACVSEDIHLSKELPVDLGGGVVGQSRGLTSPFPYYQGWIATSCESGRQLETGVGFGSFLEKNVGAIESVTLEKLQEIAQNHGFVTQTSAESREACGCAAFYPDKVGNKTPAWERDDMPAWSES